MAARLDSAGWLAAARRIPSTNCDARPAGSLVSLLVVHNISLPPGSFGGDAVEALFTNRLDPAAHPYYATLRDLRVSSHFFIRRNGSIVAVRPVRAPCVARGGLAWKGRARCNDFSIGVELEGTDTRPFTARQYARLARLIRRAADRAIRSPISPGTATSRRGARPIRVPAFDWRRLRCDSLGEDVTYAARVVDEPPPLAFRPAGLVLRGRRFHIDPGTRSSAR